MTHPGARIYWLVGIVLTAVVGSSAPGPALAEIDSGWRHRFHATSIDFDNQIDRRSRDGGYHLE